MGESERRERAKGHKVLRGRRELKREDTKS